MGIEHWSDPGSEAEPGLSKRALHQHCIQPTFKLKTYGLQYADVAESEFLMKADRGHVTTVADDRDHLPAATFLTGINQL